MDKRLDTMLFLLDDNDEVVRSEVAKQILSMGYAIVPSLETAMYEIEFEHLETFNILQSIIDKLQFNHFANQLIEWSKEPNDLLEGLWLLTKTCKNAPPNIDEINSEIERMKIEVWLELRYDLTALEKVRILNHVFFNRFSFVGNNNDFYYPNNNLLHKVLRDKKGNPIMLSVIYSLIAQRLFIPIFGVNLPQNFVLAYLDIPSTPEPNADSRGKALSPPENHEILFYINPYDKGTVFGKKHIETFVKNLNIKPQPEFFYPCSNKDIIRRVINNLVLAYQKKDQMSLAKSYWLLLNKLED